MKGGESLSHLGAADYLEKSKVGTIATAGFSCFLLPDYCYLITDYLVPLAIHKSPLSLKRNSH
jgi:hypothetical protein